MHTYKRSGAAERGALKEAMRNDMLQHEVLNIDSIL